MMIKYLAIDPGKRTGYAAFDEEGKVTEFKMIDGEDKFLDWLEEQDFEVAILEVYRNRGNQHDSWSQMPTAQHIGAIKRIIRKKKATLVEQEPSPCLGHGLRFLGLWKTYEGKHVPDEVSALAHGTYYLRKQRIQK